jgi:hypothetical protein
MAAKTGMDMTSHTQLVITPRDRFLQAAQQELLMFERREREFLRKDREDRAAELRLPDVETEISRNKTVGKGT